jgi:hypothetical protein
MDGLTAVNAPPAAAGWQQTSCDRQSLLHSANAGLIVERVARARSGCGARARAAARRAAERVNGSGVAGATAFVYDEVGGARDRIHWLIHLASFADYERLLYGGDGDVLGEHVQGGSEPWQSLFCEGSVRETFLLPHRWGAHGSATEEMAKDPSVSPIVPGERLPRFAVTPAGEQTSVAAARDMNTATAGVVMHRVADFDYQFRAEARVFACVVAENVNLNMDGVASVFLYEEPFGPMDRVHWLIHMRSLAVYYLLMGLDARVDPDAPRATFAKEWISAERGGGSWERMLVQGSVRDSALAPQRWGPPVA